MKKLAFIIFLFSAYVLAGLFDPIPSKFKPGSEPSGFRKYKWGDHFTNFYNLVLYEIYTNKITSYETDLPDLPKYQKIVYITKKYTNTKEKIKIGPIKLSGIYYGFIENRFSDLKIFVDNDTNFEILENILFNKFGKPKINEYKFSMGNIKSCIRPYEWKGKKTTVTHRGNFPFFFSSTKIDNKLNKKTEYLTKQVIEEYKKDIKNAETDF